MNLMALILFSILNEFSMASIESNESLSVETGATRVLSRRKRYLIFPDGSSFQLVFCAQNMGYIQIRPLVWFGNTAALAWELPTDPNTFYFLKNEYKLYSNRRGDDKKIVYLDEDGKVLSTVPYARKKIIVNPAFAKRSIHSRTSEELKTFKRAFVKEMHKSHENSRIVEEFDKLSIGFHRDGRKSLYTKLEALFEGLGWGGRECILRLLCETAAAKKKQGTFLEEIMRATFTFPKSHKSEDIHKEYDTAASAKDDCSILYPECNSQRSNIML